VIVESARYALVAVAKSQESGTDVAKVVIENMDYVTNECMRRFRRIAMYPRAPLVLSACVRVVKAASGSNTLYRTEIVDHVYDLCESVLDEIDVKHESQFIGVLFDVLEAVSFGVLETKLPLRVAREKTCLVMELDCPEMEPEEEDVMVDDVVEPGEARDFFEDRVSEEKVVEEGRTPDEPIVDLSRVQLLTHKILSRMSAFLSHESPHVRRQAIKTVGASLHSTHKHLEMIHLVWNQVVARLSDEDFGVVRAAMYLLIDIVNHSGDFVTRRMVELIPVFTRMDGKKQVKGVLVELFTAVLKECSLKMEDVWRIEALVLPFADEGVIRALEERDPDGIWLWRIRAKGGFLVDKNGGSRLDIP
jgi:hypothetical protein